MRDTRYPKDWSRFLRIAHPVSRIPTFAMIMILLAITILLFALYSILIFFYWKNWVSIPDFVPSLTYSPLKISVIIPARNEATTIGTLLQALEKQTYPKELFEVIVIDDHSTDATATIVQQFKGVRLIQLKEDNINSYKKKAIETGIHAASGEWIVTTDADCCPVPGWLQTIASFKERTGAISIAAPVVIEGNSSLLQLFQTLDFLVLQGITGASVHKQIHSMSNGANQSYDRNAFYEVNGFSGIDDIASGDDMLLLHKIWKKYPGKIYYLRSKQAIVATRPMETWKDFFNQRVRWASKAGRYDDKRITLVLLLVYLLNLSFLVLFVAGFWDYHYWLYLAGLWVAKTLVELPFVLSVASFFDKRASIKYFFFFQPLHILYTISAGLLGQFGRYEWKGRRVR